MGKGLWSMVYSLWSMVNSQRSKVNSLWSMGNGQQAMGNRLWATAYEQWFIDNSLWAMVYRQQTIVGGCEKSLRGKEKREREPKGKARKGARQGGLSNTRVALVSFPFGDFI